MWLRSVVVAACAALALAGCATAGSSSSSSSSAARGGPFAREYIALGVGNAWTYRVQPAPAGHDTDTVTLVSQDDRGFFVDNHGGKLQVRSDGIFDGTRFLLEDPLDEGHAWIAIPSAQVVEHYKITHVGQSVVVPAGTFEDCVEVQAEQETQNPATGQRARLTVTWTYAKGVGLVRIVQTVQVGGGTAKTMATMDLVKFKDASSSSSPADAAISPKFGG
jgi:hypothetical protein